MLHAFSDIYFMMNLVNFRKEGMLVTVMVLHTPREYIKTLLHKPGETVYLSTMVARKAK